VQCVVALILGIALVGGAYAFEHSTPDVRVLGVVAMVSMGLAVAWRGHRVGLDWRRLYGTLPAKHTLPLLAAIVPVDVLTYGAVPLFFIPLSYLAPGFVQRNLLSPNPMFEVKTVADWAILMLIGVVLAPPFEETLFRGILMQRWARRWGTPTGVVASSLLFAIGHTEILGHFLFGVTMCALYLRTRKLWLPIAAHATSNFLILLPSLQGVLSHEPDQAETLAHFRSEWWVGALALVGGTVLLWLYLRRYWPNGLLRAVLTGPTPYEASPPHAASLTGPPASTSAS
jgi:membrane protease YdiL (CAAX protease family)